MSTQQPVDRAPRYELRLSAEVKSKTFSTSGTTRNVSAGGVCVEIDRMVAEGDVLELVLFLVEDEIEAEGKRALELTATVQWAAEGDRGYQLGLRFVDPPADKVAMLERVMGLLTPT